MNLEEIVVWYQKKIGTYDKQEWEKTIEQKILNSFTNITLKSAKLKTEFIDVDLVRGSSFPKAKPKQSLLTVIRLAIFRYLFLPFYKKWWVSQTSSKIYNIFLILYIGQICNWFIYIKNYNSIDANNNEQIFSISELIIPTIISYILCLIHSFIVSTNSMNNSNTKNKQLFSKNGKLREKIRRRKKIVRNIINVEITAENIKKKYDNNNIHRKETTNVIKKIHINENDNIKKKNLKIIYKKKDDENNINSNDNKQIQKQHQENNNNNEKFKVFSNQKKLVIYNISNTSNNNNNNDNNDDVQNTNKISSLDNNNYNSNNCINNYQLFDNNYKENDYDLNNSMNYSSSTSSNNNMKRIRNVNWDSPIHNYENNDNSDIIIIDNNDSKNLFNTNNYNCNLTSTTITITTTTLTSSTMTNSKLNEKQNSNNIFNMKLSSSSSSTNKLTKTPTPTTTTTTTVIAVAAPAPAAVAAIYSTTTTSISSDINGKNQTNNSSSRDGSSSSSSSNSSNSSNSSSNCSSNNIPTTYCNNDNSNSSSNSSNNIIINNILNTTIVSSSSSSSSSLLSSSISIKTAAAATTTIATNSINSISSINTTPTTTKTKATATTTTIKNDDNNDLKNLLEPFNKDDGFESLNGKSSSGDEDNKYDDNNDNILNLNNYDLINQQQQQQLSKKLSQQQQQQDIIYNKKFDIICRKKNSNSNSNKINKINSYSSSNDNTPLVQLKLKNQRKKIKFCKNRSLLTSSVNNVINDNHYNYHNHHHNHHHHDNNYENYNSDNDKNDVVDDDDDDDDDELSDEELFKSNFDKLNKRYSIPLVRNSKRKLPYSEMELNNPSSILNLQNAYMKAMANTTTTTTLIKKSYSSTAEISSMATGTNGCNDGSVAKCDIVLGIGGLRRRTRLNRSNESSDIDEDGDDEEIAITNQNLLNRNGVYNGCSTSATEWLGITTNSEECSYSSEPNSDLKEDSDDSDHESAPNVLLNSRGSNDRISCTIWHRHDPKKAEMSVLDISSCIIERVEAMPESSDYIYIGVVCSIVLSLIPSLCRLCEATVNWETSTEVSYFDVPILLWEKTSFSFSILIELTFGKTSWEKIILIIGFFERLILTLLLFFLFAVAERTFKQRFLYAKLFSHLTSSRRARKSDLPHFRLNKVRNIKTWLSVRSYLKRRGPQRSVDVIVSTALSITLLLLGFLSVECLKDSVHIHSQVNLEALFWSGALGIYLLRFMTLGNKINRKYRSISVLITEQINLYLQIEQKPKKKDELMVANSVLKLAADLLKELESPFKISGLFANPYLYTTIKVVILSAFSGVLSEMLGFKLKLHKIKIK